MMGLPAPARATAWSTMAEEKASDSREMALAATAASRRWLTAASEAAASPVAVKSSPS